MIFSSPEFILFFLLVLAGLFLLRSHHQGKKALLLVASYYFYACWDWRLLSLIWISTLVDFFVGARMVRAREKNRRKWLLLSLFVNLGLLGYFKYCNFFIDSARQLLAAEWFDVGTLDIILPVGISFYTFQTLSYTLDIYRGHIAPRKSLLDFALFVGFFPQLVAGPIVRASHFLPQLDTPKHFTKADIYSGFQRFTYGLFKKVFLADRLAMFSDNVFAHAGAYDCPTTWLAALAYTLQIYFDFSGYSDMAIGTARIMGYDLGENFNFPYLSTSPQAFWRRWHISLSSWVRDYIYIPLGGNRKGRVRTYVNLLLSMALCGLWHGAAWTFVAWGVMHGLALAAGRVWTNHGPKLSPAWGAAVGWCLTMLMVVVGWVLFRSETFGQAFLMLGQMFLPRAGVAWLDPFVPFILTGTAAVYMTKLLGFWDNLLLPDNPRLYSPFLLFSLTWLVIMYYPKGFQPFIYFQF